MTTPSNSMTTPSVTLRRASEVDAPVLASIRAEPSAARYQPLRPYPVDRLRSLLRRRAALALDQTLDAKVQWMILADDEPAGWITLDVTDREHAIGSVGYTVRERARGRGIARAALLALVTLALEPHGVALERLEAVVASGNLASRRVLEVVGFRREGTARGLLRIGGVRLDHERYGLLRDDWQLQQSARDTR